MLDSGFRIQDSGFRIQDSGFKILDAKSRKQVSGFGPPWCDMTDSHCSLQEISIYSYLPDSYKVRSGPGVSGFSI